MWDYMERGLGDESRQRALLVALLGYLCFIFGFWGGRFVFGRVSPAWRSSDCDELKSGHILVLGFCFMLFLTSAVFARVDGFWVDGVFVMTGTSGYLNDMKVILLPALFLFYVRSGLSRSSLCLFLIALMYYLVNSHVRWVWVYGLVSLIAFSLYYRSLQLRSVIKYSPLLILVVAFFFIKGRDRDFVHKVVSGDIQQINLKYGGTVANIFDNPDMANYEYLTYIVDVVPNSSDGYTYFNNWLQLFTEPIPRFLWSGKPAGAPFSRVFLNDHGNFLGLTKSIYGDAWMGGGWIGLILACSIIGAAWALLGRSLLSGGRMEAALFFLILPLVVQQFRDGGIVSVSKMALWAVVPYFLYKCVDFVYSDEKG